MRRVSVVIPTFNRADILKECLDAVMRQDLPMQDYEVVVVDDGSLDDRARFELLLHRTPFALQACPPQLFGGPRIL